MAMDTDMDLVRHETCQDCKAFGAIWTVSKNQERTCWRCGLVADAFPLDDSYNGNKHYTDTGNALDLHVERLPEKGVWFTSERPGGRGGAGRGARSAHGSN